MAITYQALVGWGGSPYNRCVPWTDVSSRLLGFDTSRGRSTELDAIETGTAAIRFDSPDGMLTPGRPYGSNALSGIATNLASYGDSTGIHRGPNTTVTVQNTVSRTGNYNLAVSVPATIASGDTLLYTDPQPVTAGLPYVVAGNAASSAAFAGHLGIRFYNAAGVDLGFGADAGAFLDGQYKSVVLNDAPFMFNRMESATGSVSQTNTPESVPLSVVNPNGTAAGHLGTSGSPAVKYGGSTYTPVPNNVGVNMALFDRTWEFWFRVNGSASGVMFASGNNATPGTTGDAGSMPLAYIGTDGKLRAGAFTGSTTPAATSSTTVTDSLWHHLVIAVSVTRATQSIYLDGKLIGTNNSPAAVNDPKWWLGCGQTAFRAWPNIPTGGTNGWSYFDGWIADLATYRYQMNAAQVARHYAAGMASSRKLPAGTASANFALCQGAAVAPAGAVTASVYLIADSATTATTWYLEPTSLIAGNPVVGGWADHVMPDTPIQLNALINGNLAPLSMANPALAPQGGTKAAPYRSRTDPDVAGGWLLEAGTTSTVYGTTMPSGGYGLYDPASGGMVFAGTATSASAPNSVVYTGRLSHLITPAPTYVVTVKAKMNVGPSGAMFGMRYEARNYGTMNVPLNGAVPITPSGFQALSSSWQTYTFLMYVPVLPPASLFNDMGLPDLTVHFSSYSSVGGILEVSFKDVQIYPAGVPTPAFTPGDGSIPLYGGFVDSWTTNPVQGDVMEVTAACSDLWRHLAATQVDNPYRSQILNDPLLHNYWDLYTSQGVDLGPYGQNGAYSMHTANDGLQHAFSYQYNGLITGTAGTASATSGSAASSSGGPSASFTPGAVPEYSPIWGLGTTNNGANVPVGQQINFVANGMNPSFPAAGSDGHGSFECWFTLGGNTVGRNYTLIGRDFGTNPAGQLYVAISVIDSTKIAFAIGLPNSRMSTFFTAPGILAGNLTHLVLRWRVVGGGFLIEGYVNGVRVPQIGDTYTYPGQPIAWSYFGSDYPTFNSTSAVDVWQGQIGHIAYSNRRMVDASSRYQAGLDPTQSGTAPGIIATASGLDARNDTFGSLGHPTYTNTNIPNCLWGGTGVDAALQALAVQLGGVAYIDGTGNPCFQARSGDMPVIDFSGATAPDTGLTFYDTLDKLVNVVQVTNSTGAVTSYADWPSVERYGRRGMAIGTALQGSGADLAAYNSALANNILAGHSTPRVRCDSARFTCVNDALKAAALALDIGSRISFSGLPTTAPATKIGFFVESVAISVDLGAGEGAVPTVDVGLSPDYF